MHRTRPNPDLRTAAVRAAPGNALATAILGLSVMLLMFAPAGRPALAAGGHEFRFCSGYFALCAASTCTPTDKKITVNVTGGGTARFPAADCTCPIFSGQAIADLAGGNMKGSCQPPAPDQIWSLYSVQSSIAQEITGWVPTGSAAAAPYLFCPKNLDLGSTIANCFSFACDSETYINGVPVATCHCPIGESLDGVAVTPQTAFVSQAGQGDRQFCAAHPVSGPLP